MTRVNVVEWLKLPLVPLMVRVRVPVVARLLTRTDRVEVPEPVTDVGLKVGVTRDPCPLTLRFTAPVNPFTAPIVIVDVPVVPRLTVMLVGESEMVKFGVAPGAFIVREIVVVCVSEPEVAVMVTVAVPVVAVELAVNVTELVEAVGLVPKAAVTPEGKPEADNVTLPVNPPEGVTVTVLLPLLPCVTLTLDGEADRAKFGEEGGGGRTQLFAALENSS